MSLRIFIGWDSRFTEPARVLAESFRQNSTQPLDIRFLDKRHLEECYGFRRKVDDPLASTEFTYTRFLVPWLCGYEGHALFCDNDMLCFGDASKLFPSPAIFNLALYVRKHEQHAVDGSTKMGGVPQTMYVRKNWSSLMIMNCAKLRAWTPEVVATASGARLHRFQDVPDNEIGAVPDGWNDLEHQYRAGVTQLLHWTEGGPYLAGCENCPHAELWRSARREWLTLSGGDPETPLALVQL
jgi:hypothetical protein